MLSSSEILKPFEINLSVYCTTNILFVYNVCQRWFLKEAGQAEIIITAYMTYMDMIAVYI